MFGFVQDEISDVYGIAVREIEHTGRTAVRNPLFSPYLYLLDIVGIHRQMARNFLYPPNKLKDNKTQYAATNSGILPST